MEYRAHSRQNVPDGQAARYRADQAAKAQAQAQGQGKTQPGWFAKAFANCTGTSCVNEPSYPQGPGARSVVSGWNYDGGRKRKSVNRKRKSVNRKRKSVNRKRNSRRRTGRKH